jgi:biotin carboxyl carrier protein
MKLVYSIEGSDYSLDIARHGDFFEIGLLDKQIGVRLVASVPPRITFLYGDSIVTAYVASEGSKRWVHFDGMTIELERRARAVRRDRAHRTREGTGSGILVAPMPGQVRAILVSEGAAVTEGEPLLLLEAMKMELQIAAPHDGVVINIGVTEGQSVEREQVLGEIK